MLEAWSLHITLFCAINLGHTLIDHFRLLFGHNSARRTDDLGRFRQAVWNFNASVVLFSSSSTFVRARLFLWT
ncbi:hypothetical protein BDV18DRAFT_108704 [Aspergillus unguis]